MINLCLVGMMGALVFAVNPGNDLLDYINTQTYWQSKKVQIQESTILNEIRTPAPVKGVNKLIKEMGSSSFKKREEATNKLRNIGKGALPILKQAAESKDIEVSVRARKLVAELSTTETTSRIQQLMAIRTLGELKSKKALSTLKDLSESTDPFTADYSKAAIAAIEGKPYMRPGADKKTLLLDLARLPADCALATQIRIDEPGDDSPRDIFNMLNSFLGMQDGGHSDPSLAIMKLAEKIGNVRINAVTLGLDSDIGDDKGFVTAYIRGIYDSKTIRTTVKDGSAKNNNFTIEKVGGVPFFAPEDEFMLSAASDRLFIAIGGPNRSHLPAVKIVSAFKNRNPKPGNTKLNAMITDIDDKNIGRGAVIMSDSYKVVPEFAVVNNATMTIQQNKDMLSAKLIANCSDENIAKATVAKFTQIINEMLDDINDEIGDMKEDLPMGAPDPGMGMMLPDTLLEPMERTASLLASIKFQTKGTQVTITAQMQGSASVLFLAPLMFLSFELGDMDIMEHNMPPHFIPNEIDPFAE